MKKCSKCKKIKPLSGFWKSSRQKDGKYTSCSDCQRIANKKWRERNPDYELNRRLLGRDKTPSRIYSRILDSGKKRNIPIEISREGFVKWHDSQETKCVYCGVFLSELGNQDDSQLKKFKNTLSIDRKDNNKGYSVDNMVLACIRCNFIKGDFFTFSEMKEIGKRYVKPKRNKSC